MQSYQLHIRVGQPIKFTTGKLGIVLLPAGIYTYTGSASKNIYTRVDRHLSSSKKLKWHIDYLLSQQHVNVIGVRYSVQEECKLNQASDGDIVIQKFGATDCTHGCGSHLKLRRSLDQKK